MLAVIGGQGPQAVRGQELALVEQLGEQPFQPVRPAQAEQQPLLAGLPAQQADARRSLSGSARPCRSRKSANRLPTVSARRRSSSVTTTAARAGMMPTIDRTLTGTASPLGVMSRS